MAQATGSLLTDGVFFTFVSGAERHTFVIATDLLPTLASTPIEHADGSLTVSIVMPDGVRRTFHVAGLDAADTRRALDVLVARGAGTSPPTAATAPPEPTFPAPAPSPALANRSGSVPPRAHPQGTTVLVLGILGVTICCVLAPVAWAVGNSAVREMDSRPDVTWTNRDNVLAGRVCGIIGTSIVALVLVLILLSTLVSG